ncbi:methylenetetrahydrofolate reductase C-terminal domain-containing protein [Candidatus Peregrinibacteria bacterium]|nr:methylenetetrahydrofolate reductase C-terminal domain-containing protein [Candidatus Peregrinibacteria bacterium]
MLKPSEVKVVKDKNIIPETFVNKTKLTFREAIQKRQFSVTWELVPGRGAWEKSQEHVMRMAELAAKNPRINGITITDNPGGKPAILTIPVAVEVLRFGIEPVIHFTCKDKNRNDIESELYAIARLGLKNLLVMTGDYPSEGYMGLPKPVFDLDSVQTLRLINFMNIGEAIPSFKGNVTLQKTDFFAGAVVSPFKYTEAEIMAQYYKLHKKIQGGAKFIITQLGYDARKFDEIKKYMDECCIDVPLIGNIFVLGSQIAKLMNKGTIPGCVVSDELLAVIEKEKNEKNFIELQLERSARLYAIFSGLGYGGVNISGHGLGYENIVYIVERGVELSRNWVDVLDSVNYSQKNAFYYYEKDCSRYFNSDTPVNRKRTGAKAYSVKFFIMSVFHKLLFNRDSILFPLIRFLMRIIDNTFLRKPFALFEYYIKTFTNQCRFCGDCAIHELGFICPMAICPKQQRNGACGGSRNGWCEVYPGKQKCIFVIMYGYYKAAGKEEIMKDGYIPPCNWDLHRTSSWINFFLGRDYSSKRCL